jgi:hypothetical protein
MPDVGVLTGNASGDDDDVGSGERILQAVVLGQVASDFLSLISGYPRVCCIADSWEVCTAGLEMWDRSVATPGELTTS